MALFKGRSSLLEVQNRALMKTAKERAAQIDRLERELQRQEGEQIGRLGRELQILQERAERQTKEIERLTLERDFYSKRASALEQQNRELTESATKYSVHAQKLERDLTEVATKYSMRAQQLERELTETTIRAQKLERELTETATKYSLWGQKLERELARIDPDGAPARRFEAQHES
jgi:chromosome segregation ATPase